MDSLITGIANFWTYGTVNVVEVGTHAFEVLLAVPYTTQCLHASLTAPHTVRACSTSRAAATMAIGVAKNARSPTTTARNQTRQQSTV